MDTVCINELAIDAVVGIFEWERQVPQRLVINIEMASDITPAAKSQSIEDALDYSAVARRTTDLIVNSQFLLLETLVEQTADMIMTEFNVPWLQLSCMKTQVLPNVGGVGVKIERGVKNA